MTGLSLDLDPALEAFRRSGSVIALPEDLADRFGVDPERICLHLEDIEAGPSRLAAVRRLFAGSEDAIAPGFAFARIPDVSGLTLCISDAEDPGQPLGYMSLALEAEWDRARPEQKERPVWVTLTLQAIFVTADRREEGWGRALAAGGCALARDLLDRAAQRARISLGEIRSEVTGRALAPESARLMRKMEDALDAMSLFGEKASEFPAAF